jgi:hypothetical protein
MPGESTPILHHKRRRTTGTDYQSTADGSGRPSRQGSRIEPTRHSSFRFMKRRTGAYDEDLQGLIDENTGVRVWYENYSSIGKYKAMPFNHIEKLPTSFDEIKFIEIFTTRLDPRSYQGKAQKAQDTIDAWYSGLYNECFRWRKSVDIGDNHWFSDSHFGMAN